MKLRCAVLCLVVAAGSGPSAYGVVGADLKVAGTARPNPVVAGRGVSYALTVHNAGPAAAQEVRLTDAVPGAIQPLSVKPGGGTLCELAGQNVTCTRDRLAAGESSVIVIAGTVAASTRPGVLVNTATARAEAPVDPSGSDNTAKTPVTVTARADLAVLKSMTAKGRRVTFTLLVRNHGPSDAADVLVVDDLPDGLSKPRVSATPGLTCSIQQWIQQHPDPGVVTCTGAPFRSGTGAVVTIVATRTSWGKLTNTARVSSRTPDPVPGNNQDTVS